jgi:glycosyltransferase involved in cell wall biosynthesis
VKIAVDARPLQHPHSGIGRYTYEILQRLVQRGHEWFLYGAPADVSHWSDRVIVRPSAAAGLAGQLAAWRSYPRWVKQDGAELFWSPRHHLPALSPGVRAIVTIHDFVWHFYPKTMPLGRRILERTLMPQAIARADRIIAISQSTANDLVKLFPRHPAVDVIPLAAASFSSAEEIPSVFRAESYFLFVGTQEPRKNLRRLIAAWSKVADELKPVSLVLVGGKGWGGQHIEAWVDEFGVRSSVRVMGDLSDVMLGEAYRNAIALVMPSLYEGFGLPLLEAMHHGTPVITANFGATAEVVGDGGLLVEPSNIDSIAMAMRRMNQDKALRDQLSLSAIHRAQDFSWEHSAEQTWISLEKTLLT